MPDTIIHTASLVDEQTASILTELVAARWFYYLDLVGTFAFAVSGVIKAYKLNYDYFGAFLLATLPAVGGGTLRDLLVGGARHPPFIFRDPTYMYIVFIVVLSAILLPGLYRHDHRRTVPLGKFIEVFDTIGIAAFTVIGAKVAILAGLDWFWAPILAALTCSGGGVISNAVTGHESEVLKGELYEEIGAAGGLFLVCAMSAAPLLADPRPFLATCVVLTLLGVFTMRYIVLSRGLRSPTLDWDVDDSATP